MCKYCEDDKCTLTKEQAIQHGAIIEDNASSIMRLENEDSPQTYSFYGVRAYDSFSALFPDESDKNPHAYIRFIYDEDEDCSKDWECTEVQYPLKWQTEEEFLKKLSKKD